MMQTSWPSRSRATESVPITSARPPVLAKGLTSEAIMAIFILFGLSGRYTQRQRKGMKVSGHWLPTTTERRRLGSKPSGSKFGDWTLVPVIPAEAGIQALVNENEPG